MKGTDSNPGFSVIPKGEKTCVWMDAGLVNFKLCDLDFQCDKCPFNRAMEASYGSKALNGGETAPVLHERFESAVPSGLWRFRLDTSLYMNAFHTWIRPMGMRNVRIGLDDFVVSMLGGVDRVVLPNVGKQVKRGSPVAEVLQGKRVFSVLAPVTGKVTGVNRRLLKYPGLLVQEPIIGGYLCEIEASDLDQALRVCKTGKALLRWYYHEIEWVERRVTEALDMDRSVLGETAFDGGTVAPFSEILPDPVYRDVVSGLLGTADKND